MYEIEFIMLKALLAKKESFRKLRNCLKPGQILVALWTF